MGQGEEIVLEGKVGWFGVDDFVLGFVKKVRILRGDVGDRLRNIGYLILEMEGISEMEMLCIVGNIHGWGVLAYQSHKLLS